MHASQDLKLANNKYKYAKSRDLDRLFLTINTTTTLALKQSKNAAKGGEPIVVERDEAKALSRVEFMVRDDPWNPASGHALA